jgi:transcription antitermination factor NusG
MADFCGHESIAHYLPLRRETKIYQRRKVTVEKPLFPGYLFVRLDHDERQKVLKTNNIVRTIETSRQRELLHQLAQIRKALAVDPTLGSCEAIKAGRRVRILGGPFRGIEGCVVSIKGHDVVRLNIELIGQAVALDIQRDYLEPAD